MRSASSLLSLTLLIVLTTGCPQREVAEIVPDPAKETEKAIPVQINRNLDILFVVDSSLSMEDELRSLALNFGAFIQVLDTIEGGRPSLHIGVISPDVDLGVSGIGNCESGDVENGRLQSEPRGDFLANELDPPLLEFASGRATEDCTGPDDNYIIDEIVNEETGERRQNYSGELADTFSCIAALGKRGCGFEQHLEAMRRALDGSNPENAGFLREDAFLAVIIIADEDDCSSSDSAMFGPDDPDGEFGIRDSFRCFEFGVQCDPDLPRDQLGPRQDCIPRIDSPYMHDVNERYVSFLRDLKSHDPGLLITAGILGPLVEQPPLEICIGPEGCDREPRSGGELGGPEVKWSCKSSTGEAAPAIRTNTFLSQFPNRNTTTSICQEDLSPALTQIADLLKEVIGNPCLEGDLVIGDDGFPNCTVEDVVRTTFGEEEEGSRTVIPKCSDSGPPCWDAVEDPANCNLDANEDYITGLALEVDRGGGEPQTGTFTEVHCEEN